MRRSAIVVLLSLVGVANANSLQEQQCVDRIARILGLPSNQIRPAEPAGDAGHAAEITVSTPSGPATCWTKDAVAPAESRFPSPAAPTDPVLAAGDDACAASLSHALGVPMTAIRVTRTTSLTDGGRALRVETPFGIAGCTLDATNAVRAVRPPGVR